MERLKAYLADPSAFAVAAAPAAAAAEAAPAAAAAKVIFKPYLDLKIKIIEYNYYIKLLGGI